MGTSADTPDTISAGIRSGVTWKAFSQVTLQISRMAVALVLARLLSPDDWGIAAMVLALSAFVVVFTDSALGTALIQRARLHEDDRSTVFWASVATGLVLMVTGFALAGPIAGFYGEPEVEPLMLALAIGFLVTSLGTTHMALLAREMQFRRLELRQIAATVVGAASGIGIAVGGGGPWSIVGMQLAEAVTSTLLLWALMPWRPSLRFSAATIRRLGGFAGNVFGENVLYQAGRSLGTLLVGRSLGAAALGAYALANTVILIPFARIAAPLQQVFFPAFSRMRGDRERIADVWIRATRLVGLLSIPSLVGLVVVAPDFVEVVLGATWSEATPVIQILAWVGIVQSLQTLSGEVLLALNRSGTLLRFTTLWFAATVAAFVIGIRWGIVGVAASYLVATLLLEPVRLMLTTRALGIPFRRPLHALVGIAQAVTVMAVAALLARAALVAVGMPATARLVIVTMVGAAVYVAACLWRARDTTEEVRNALRRRRRPTPRPQPLERPLL